MTGRRRRRTGPWLQWFVVIRTYCHSAEEVPFAMKIGKVSIENKDLYVSLTRRAINVQCAVTADTSAKSKSNIFRLCVG